jgi:TolB-like protein/tetratricopeptide (TPR) repeat protein
MSKIVRFGCFEADLDSGQLFKRGIRVRLRDQSFQVLESLLRQPGRVVTREELRQRLWRNEVFVDFDNNLNIVIARLREALGDSAEHPRFIETLPKRGYRFLVNIDETLRVHNLERAYRARLIVLPFLNLSGDPAQEYVSDAVTDEVIAELASVAPEQLAVIARTTAMQYKGSRKDVSRVGRELKVDYVVEGAVSRADSRIRITAQLVRAKDQMHVWAQSYNADLRDIFDVQARVAQAIAKHIGVAPVAARVGQPNGVEGCPVNKPTEDLVAYDEHIQGRHEFATLSPDAFARAKQHFEAAIARDPNFALAYDSLADVYWWLGYLGFMRPVDAFSLGVLYAVRALEIDGTLAETHALLAQYNKQLHYDWPEVEREMARALALNPNSPLVRTRYAWSQLMPQGRLEEAAAELDFALELDPLNTHYRTGLAFIFAFWRRFDCAWAEAQRLLKLDPKAYWGHYILAVCYREQGLFQESIASCRRAVELSGNTPAMLGWLGLTLACGGDKTEARTLLERLHKMASNVYLPPTSFAFIHLGLGEIDETFQWLDRAVEECDQYLMPIKSYAFMDPIRKDPRFAALLRKMNLET